MCCIRILLPPLIGEVKRTTCIPLSSLCVDSDSEEDEPHFFLASESSGKKQSAPRPNHNLSLLSLSVIIGKGRLQARTDKKVRLRPQTWF